jgi:signal transduction histidine kinase
MIRFALFRRGGALRPRLGDRAWVVFLGWMAVVTSAYAVAHFTGPRWLNSGLVFNVIGVSAVVAIVVGARRNVRGCRLPWYLFALGQLFYVLGDVFSDNHGWLFGGALPSVSVADAFYLAFYLPLIAGLLLLIRERPGAQDRESLIDSLVITVAAAAFSWTFLMAPDAHQAASLPTKLVALAYPLMDVLVLGVLVRLLVANGPRAIGFAFLVLGFGAQLVADSIYGWQLLHDGYVKGSPVDIGWAIFYALLGASALHPSTRALFERQAAQTFRLTGRRIALLGTAALAVPALLLVRAVLATNLDVGVLAVASAALFVLVILRMTGLMHRHAEAVQREADRTAELAAAEQSAKAKDQFVSQVSHELRTPLTSIRGFLAMLLDDDADGVSAAERDTYLAVIDRNAGRLLRLVEDLLFVAQMDEGRLVLDKTEFDLVAVLAEAVEAARPLADLRHIELRDQTETEVRLLGDRDRVAQVIDNLLSNALKFTPEGGEVTVDIARSNGTARLMVADTGVGMRRDELGHLFERFYRTDAATAEAVQGSGLGLSICKAIVEAHAGTITADSLLGHGTTLAIELPTGQQPSHPVPPDS